MKEPSKNNNRPSGIFSFPFWILMIILTVVSFILPLRPTKSLSEKRSLAAFPEFSVKALASGSYFDDITLWFSDTFPGRETWLQAASKVDALHGINDIAFSGSDFHADAVPVVKPKSDTSGENKPEESEVSSPAESEAEPGKSEASEIEEGEASGAGEMDESGGSDSPETAERETLAGKTAEGENSGSGEISEPGEMGEQGGSDPAETASAKPESSETEEGEPGEITKIEAPKGPVHEWGGVDAGDAENAILGNVIQIGNAAYSYFGFSEYYSTEYAHLIADLASDVKENDVRVICAPVPSAVGVMVPPEYQEMLMCSEQNAVLEYIGSELGDDAIMVNMYPNLVRHNDEYLYFRTDHHWAGLGAFYGYQSICAATGANAAPLASFEAFDQGEFIGSIYGSAPAPYNLEIDDVITYDPPGDISFMISDDGYNFWDWPIITDLSGSDRYSKYMAFIAGDHALSLAVNDSIPDGKTCVVIKDSCGNPMIPFLTQNYHKVYVLDFRKYGNMCLSTFAEEYDVDDIIFCHMLGMVQSDGAMQLFRWLIQ